MPEEVVDPLVARGGDEDDLPRERVGLLVSSMPNRTSATTWKFVPFLNRTAARPIANWLLRYPVDFASVSISRGMSMRTRGVVHGSDRARRTPARIPDTNARVSAVKISRAFSRSPAFCPITMLTSLSALISQSPFPACPRLVPEHVRRERLHVRRQHEPTDAPRQALRRALAAGILQGMNLIAPRDRSFSRRFEIVDGPNETGPRLGGRCPAIALPRLRHDAHYVLTFPLAHEPELEASVFVNCGFDVLVGAMNDGVCDDERVVIEVHGPAPRGVSDRFAAEISAHAIVVGNAQSDWESDGDGGRVPWSSHKIGGRPYCIQEPELPGAAALFAGGWVHVLQLDFPVRTSVKGNWPFGDGLFNVFIDPRQLDQPRWAFQK